MTPEQRVAYAAVARARRRGELQAQPCEVCGAPRGHAHHRWGYSEPLRVAWLCASHHQMEHAPSPSAGVLNVFGPWRETIPGLTMNEVARRAQINSGRLSIIERGVEPSPTEAARLRAVLIAASDPAQLIGEARA